MTRALCNECGLLTDAKVVFRDGGVYLAKWCADHGRTEALICDSVEWYLRSLPFIKPGAEPLQRAVATHEGCPTSCGLCPAHQQHTCVPIIEITDRCDLDCPACLVGRRGRDDLSVEQVSRIVDDLLRYEGVLNMVNISGGEPTLHPDLLGVVDAVLRPEVGIVSLSTNGLSLARRPELIAELRDRGVVISLQLDGLTPGVWQTLRGRDLTDEKRRAIDNILACDGAQMSLIVTLARNVNEGELRGILDLFFAHKQIVSLMIQPCAHVGHGATRLDFDPLDVVTIPEAVRRLAAASRGVLEESDFSPLPCSHPSCFTLTYLLETEQGRPVPLPRLVQPDDYLDIIKNQALLNTDVETLQRIKDALYMVWCSKGQFPRRDDVLKAVKQLLLDLNNLDRNASLRELLSVGTGNVKSIFIHHFMDRYTFDLSRVVKCCNHYPQPDGRLLPACIRNVTPRLGTEDSRSADDS